jgi:hypothetical protein
MAQPVRITSLVPLLLLGALAAPPALALVQRAFVASYGLDTNPCSLALPCRSFDIAIPKVVSGGEVIVLDSAGYGPTTITQSVSLIAPAGVYAGISVIAPAKTVGVDINGVGIKVVLQNIAINGLGGDFGVYLEQAAEVDINNCTISNFGVAGIMSIASNAELTVRDTLVRDIGSAAGTAGVSLGGSTRAVFERTRIVRSGFGISVESGSSISIKRSVIAGNDASGLFVSADAGAVAAATVEDSLIADNANYALAAVGNGVGGVAKISAVATPSPTMPSTVSSPARASPEPASSVSATT